MQRELDNARSLAESSKREFQTAKNDDDTQLQQWKDRYARLEEAFDRTKEDLSRSERQFDENDVGLSHDLLPQAVDDGGSILLTVSRSHQRTTE
jgi:hypothetical protein